jgi:hypothetical protein
MHSSVGTLAKSVFTASPAPETAAHVVVAFVPTVTSIPAGPVMVGTTLEENLLLVVQSTPTVALPVPVNDVALTLLPRAMKTPTVLPLAAHPIKDAMEALLISNPFVLPSDVQVDRFPVDPF